MGSSRFNRTRSLAASYLISAIAAILVFTVGSAPAKAAFATIHNFIGSPADGSEPFGTVVEDPITGDYFGTTSTGGTHGLGVIYSMTPGFVVTIIHNFAGIDGAKPTCTLILAPGTAAVPSVLYGTTLQGGKFNLGVVFRISATGAGYARLHNFAGAPGDGAYPVAGVIRASDGRLYGTTLIGGKFNLGTTYRIGVAGGAYLVTHDFSGVAIAGVPPDGANPMARLFEWKAGFLVGTTMNGGGPDFGTVFTETLAGGAYALLHQFANIPDGAHPTSEVILLIAPTGAPLLWGTARDGGAFGDGMIYSLTPGGPPYTDEFDFPGGVSGANPYGALVFDPATGYIYGTTENGGPTGNGIVYLASPTPVPPIPVGVLHPFLFGEGEHPLSALYLNPVLPGLIGSTRDGGNPLDGTLFIQSP